MLSSFRPRIALADISAICVPSHQPVFSGCSVCWERFSVSARGRHKKIRSQPICWQPNRGARSRAISDRIAGQLKSDRRLSDRIVRPWSLAAFAGWHGKDRGIGLEDGAWRHRAAIRPRVSSMAVTAAPRWIAAPCLRPSGNEILDECAVALGDPPLLTLSPGPSIRRRSMTPRAYLISGVLGKSESQTPAALLPSPQARSPTRTR
jgi:hypothetical protein